ncbi:unnamed protein product [Dibothriocephalus latus]|uniref:Uncharacterized protein n=1 Tax=Dibothriocephalus latus TaxID=60516 RepID=A0A3P7QDI3_DIBLA|nr:unnamed protein product [Dibothriocephalus latus]
MAPRTDSKFLNSTLDIRSPCCDYSVSPEKDVYAATVPRFLQSDSANPQFNDMSNSPLPISLATSADIHTEAVDARLRRLTARCRLAERRAILILSKLKSPTPGFRPSSETQPNRVSEEHLWYQARATMRSHWFLLQTEMVRALDCLQNLRPLRHRCKKWRKSLPLLSQGGLIEPATMGTCSRILPFEKSDKPRHSYFSLNNLKHLDFKFSGETFYRC